MSNSNSINKINGKIDKNTYKNASPIDFNVGDGVIGSYDNILLKTTCNQGGWKAEPCNPPLLKNKLFVPQGTPLPLKSEMVFSEIPDDSMFIFSRSYSSPDCCPSTFSTDRGCVCTSPNMRKYIGEMRGKNMTYNNYNF